MYNIVLVERAEKFLDKLNNKDIERILRALERLRIRPETYLIRLVGDKAYKFRFGEYRLIIDLKKKDLVILVVKIGHRKKIYD